MNHQCKKCLLLEAGESKAYQTVRDYLDNLENELRVDNNLYEQRLNECRLCSELISGMCLKCGCYVEIRAALKDKHCPDFDSQRW